MLQVILQTYMCIKEGIFRTVEVPAPMVMVRSPKFLRSTSPNLKAKCAEFAWFGPGKSADKFFLPIKNIHLLSKLVEKRVLRGFPLESPGWIIRGGFYWWRKVEKPDFS